VLNRETIGKNTNKRIKRDKRRFLSKAGLLCCFLLWAQTSWAAQKILLVIGQDTRDYAMTRQVFKVGLDLAVKQKGQSIEWLELKQIGENKQEFIDNLKEMEDDIDLVFVAGTPTAMSVLESGINKPVLFAAVANPKKANLVNNLHSPGRNFTGAYCAVSANRQLQTVLSYLPKTKNITIVYNPFDPAPAAQVEDWSKAISILKNSDIRLSKIKIPEQVNSSQAMLEFMNTIDPTMDVLITTADAKIANYGSEIIQFAIRNKVPMYSSLNSLVEEGALFSLGFKFKEAAQQISVSQAIKILNGVLPKDIPVGTLPEYSLVFNLKTAQQIGIEFSEKIIESADELIQ